MLAFLIAATSVFGSPIVSGVNLVHFRNSDKWILFLVLPSLLIAAWGLGSGTPPEPITDEPVAVVKTKRSLNRLKLGCAAFLIAPIGSTILGIAHAYSSSVMLMDRPGVIVTYASIGFFAGCLVALGILFASFSE